MGIASVACSASKALFRQAAVVATASGVLWGSIITIGSLCGVSDPVLFSCAAGATMGSLIGTAAGLAAEGNAEGSVSRTSLAAYAVGGALVGGLTGGLVMPEGLKILKETNMPLFGASMASCWGAFCGTAVALFGLKGQSGGVPKKRAIAALCAYTLAGALLGSPSLFKKPSFEKAPQEPTISLRVPAGAVPVLGK